MARRGKQGSHPQMGSTTVEILESERQTQSQPVRIQDPPPVTTEVEDLGQSEDLPSPVAATRPKRIAVIATIYRYLSHAQHFADRFLVGYPYGGRWQRPNCKIVSLYVDQQPEGDQSQDRVREFGFAVYPTIAEALRCGGDRLACDAGANHRRARRVPQQRKGTKALPALRVFQRMRQGL